MQIIGISGLPGSGKSLVSKMASEKGAIIVSMGDIIREKAKKRGESSKETAQNLRAEHGDFRADPVNKANCDSIIMLRPCNCKAKGCRRI